MCLCVYIFYILVQKYKLDKTSFTGKFNTIYKINKIKCHPQKILKLICVEIFELGLFFFKDISTLEFKLKE
jgi:hypothetical protein